MENISLELIKSVNYWESAPKRLGYLRTHYIQQVIAYLDNHLLKVLIGQRRCGKSVVLKQVISHLVEQGTPQVNILYLNFELHQLQIIKTAESLADTLELYFNEIKPKGKVYLLLDEIQEVEAWEKIVNSYLANDHFELEIIITGSNAHLLSTELSTYVTGRYVEIPIFPFSFHEYCELNKKKMDRLALITFLESSGIPELFYLKDDNQKISYLMSLKDSIVMNDIVKRFNVKNPKLLTLMLDFMIDNIGHLLSISSIVKKLKSTGMSLTGITISNYLGYLEQTFLVHAISRYDIRGKKILEGQRKYYLNDLGFSNYLQSSFDDGINRKLENYVYQALVQEGFSVYVGSLYQLEIDFIAEKNKQKIYIQVAYLLHSQNVIDREYGNLQRIKDHWPKWVVSLDEITIGPKDGIQHIPAWQLADKLKL